MAYEWGSPPQSRTVAFYHRRVGELVQEKLQASGLTWEEAALLNDEYGRDFLAELLGYVDLPSQQGSPYTMSKWTGQPGDMWWTVPYSVLTDDEYTLTSGPLRPGSTTLPHKQGTYLTTRGRLTLDEYNADCRDFTPAICQEPYRFLDDAWVRGHADTPLADELYRIDQRGSVLEGRGAGVPRAEMDEIRAKRAAT